MKKSSKWVIIVSVILLIVIIVLGVIFRSHKEIDNAAKFKEEYTQVTENNPFVYKNEKEIIKILKYGTGVVYFGFPECPWCQAYVYYLEKSARKNGIEKIYYYNIKEAREKNTKEYKKIVSLTSKYLDNDEEGNKRIFVPDIYVVKNGKILSHDNETSVVEEDIFPIEYWTDEKVKSLNKKLDKMFEPLKAKVCTDCNK